MPKHRANNAHHQCAKNMKPKKIKYFEVTYTKRVGGSGVVTVKAHTPEQALVNARNIVHTGSAFHDAKEVPPTPNTAKGSGVAMKVKNKRGGHRTGAGRHSEGRKKYTLNLIEAHVTAAVGEKEGALKEFVEAALLAAQKE